MKKETVIYISDNCIELVVGMNDHKDMMKIYDYRKYPFHEGSMINGIVMDEAGVKEALTQMKNDGFNKVSVILHSTQIVTKKLTIPKMKQKHILQYVKDELGVLSGHEGEETIYDYAYLEDSDEGKGATNIMGCAVSKEFITSYITLFESCGIEIKTIDVFDNVIVKAMKEFVPDQLEQAIFTLLDGNNAISSVFENGELKIPHRTRIVSPKESSGYAQEITMNISHVYQANKGTDGEAIKYVYIGYLGDNQSVLDNVASSLNVEAQTFPNPKTILVINEGSNGKEPFQLSEYLVSAGYLMKK